MKHFKLLLPLITFLLSSGCASFGPTVLIETPEPAEDFVVLCEWYKDGLLNIHGGMKQSDWKAFVTESGKEVDCGMSIWGGEGSATIMHPLYAGGRACEVGCDSELVIKEDDIYIIRPHTLEEALDLLVKRHSGKDVLPYIRNYGSVNRKYYKYYKINKPLDIKHMRELYDKRLINYWYKLKNIRESFGGKFIQPEKHLEYYWKTANEGE